MLGTVVHEGYVEIRGDPSCGLREKGHWDYYNYLPTASQDAIEHV